MFGMTKKRVIGEAAEPQALTSRKLAALCARWSALEDERIELQRQRDNRAGEQAAIENELQTQLHLAGRVTMQAGGYEFGHELVLGSLYYKQELIREIGQEEFDRRQAAVQRRPRFFLRERAAPRRKRKAA